MIVLDHIIIMVLCFFIVDSEVKMKVLLIFILFSVATTGVLSAVIVDAADFVGLFMYLPYKDKPGKYTIQPHAKQFFALALIPSSKVKLQGKTTLSFTTLHQITDLRTIPWKYFAKEQSVSYPLWHGVSDMMSLYISFVDYSQYKEGIGLPSTAHPDHFILQSMGHVLKEYATEFQKEAPAVVLMYSYYTPCNDCTDELIAKKKTWSIPKSTPIFLGYSKPYDKGGQTPEANMMKLTRNGFMVFQVKFKWPRKLFSLEYLRQILQ